VVFFPAEHQIGNRAENLNENNDYYPQYFAIAGDPGSFG
jgi:hypothetical protein